MSSHTLPLKMPDVSLSSVLRRSPTPIHAAFASQSDLLAALWEPGVVEIFDLKTRLGAGRGKTVDPITLWSGILEGAGPRSYRQAVFDQSHGLPGSMRISVLGTDPSGDTNDVVCVLDVQGQEGKQTSVPLPAQSGRLIPGKGVSWQSPDGNIYQGQSISSGFMLFVRLLTMLQSVRRHRMSPKSRNSPSFAFGPLRHQLTTHRNCTLVFRTRASCTFPTAKAHALLLRTRTPSPLPLDSSSTRLRRTSLTLHRSGNWRRFSRRQT